MSFSGDQVKKCITELRHVISVYFYCYKSHLSIIHTYVEVYNCVNWSLIHKCVQVYINMLRLTIDSTGVFYSLERVDLVRSDLASLRDLHAVDGGRVAEAVLQSHPTLYNALNKFGF